MTDWWCGYRFGEGRGCGWCAGKAADLQSQWCLNKSVERATCTVQREGQYVVVGPLWCFVSGFGAGVTRAIAGRLCGLMGRHPECKTDLKLPKECREGE